MKGKKRKADEGDDNEAAEASKKTKRGRKAKAEVEKDAAKDDAKEVEEGVFSDGEKADSPVKAEAEDEL